MRACSRRCRWACGQLAVQAWEPEHEREQDDEEETGLEPVRFKETNCLSPVIGVRARQNQQNHECGGEHADGGKPRLAHPAEPEHHHRRHNGRQDAQDARPTCTSAHWSHSMKKTFDVVDIEQLTRSAIGHGQVREQRPIKSNRRGRRGIPGKIALDDLPATSAERGEVHSWRQRSTDRGSQSRRVPGSHNPPAPAIFDLVGQAAGVGCYDRPTMRHGFQGHQGASLVQRRVDEESGPLVPRMQRRIVEAPGQECALEEAQSRNRGGQPPAIGAIPDDDPLPSPGCNHGRVIAQRCQRFRQDMKALALFQPSHAQQNDLVARNARFSPDPDAIGESCQSIEPCQIDGVRDRGDPAVGKAEMSLDGWLETAVCCDHSIGRFGADEHGFPKWQVRDTLESCPPGIGRAKFFETLRVHHERRRDRSALACVAEHAGAKAMDDINLPALDEIERHSAGPFSEEWIRRASVDDGRSPSSGQREGPIGDRDQPEPRDGSIGRRVRIRVLPSVLE